MSSTSSPAPTRLPPVPLRPTSGGESPAEAFEGAAATAAPRGFPYRGAILALAVVAVPVLAWSFWPKLSWSSGGPSPLMHVVARGDFIHEITERGNVESANNLEIRCEVKSKNLSGTTILEIVSEGTLVKAGNVLAKLDSSALETEQVNQQIVCNNSAAEVITARNTYETALIAKQEYIEGTYQQEVQTIEGEIFVAEESLSRAQEYLRYSERLAAKGYVTPPQLEADRFAVEKARKDLDAAKTKLDVLQKYTREKMVKTLTSDIKTAEAKLKAQEASHQLDLEQLALAESQIKKCVIVAPEEGQVVYANVNGRWGNREVIIAEGETVRERQTIFRLPDTRQMQVKTKINEARVTLVEPGMPATIRLDAFPDLVLQGAVDKVEEFPVPASFFGADVKEYETTIRVQKPPEGMRPGLTAEVKILVQRLPGVLAVPVQAVFEHGGKFYCVLGEPGQWRAQEVAIGASNDKSVVVKGGLSEGQSVLLNAAAYREQLDLPKLSPDAERGSHNGALQRRAAAPAAAEAPAKTPEKATSRSRPDAAARLDRMIQQLDANGDGALQSSEWPAPLEAMLKAADANGDGTLDRAELQAAMRKMPSQPGGATGREGSPP